MQETESSAALPIAGVPAGSPARAAARQTPLTSLTWIGRYEPAPSRYAPTPPQSVASVHVTASSPTLPSARGRVPAPGGRAIRVPVLQLPEAAEAARSAGVPGWSMNEPTAVQAPTGTHDTDENRDSSFAPGLDGSLIVKPVPQVPALSMATNGRTD